ncbi:WXG100 family type VII secretion target [Microbacterium resistens]|uniref:ESAT-6-like protein n=1 Tax=Microbacterium resistens TaxID=156977 RepID=A0ABU1SH21_9MICO|nr:WXG100 family type VII secretion target [Microbacterium resistens]MDR6868917.1 WXG100 family type VII secretion target [Microbacterium resistens]
MTVFTVDTDAVFAATTALRGTAERLQAESATMMSQLTALQSSWTGQAAAAFQGTAEQWRGAQTHVEQVLGAIGAALDHAGQQYAQAEDYSASLFR